MAVRNLVAIKFDGRYELLENQMLAELCYELNPVDGSWKGLWTQLATTKRLSQVLAQGIAFWKPNRVTFPKTEGNWVWRTAVNDDIGTVLLTVVNSILTYEAGMNAAIYLPADCGENEQPEIHCFYPAQPGEKMVFIPKRGPDPSDHAARILEKLSR